MQDGATPRGDNPQAIRSSIGYSGRTAVLATKHGKLGLIAPAMRTAFGTAVLTVDIATDQLGTFSGEIPRTLSDLDCAISKARLAMEERGSDLGMASEGTFSPHPDVPFPTTDRELVVLVDDRLDHVIWEYAVSTEIVALTATVHAEADLLVLAIRADLAHHAVIVCPEAAVSSSDDGVEQIALVEPIRHKGIRQLSEFVFAVQASCAASVTYQAVVTTDFRAHCCPSRQVVITSATERPARCVASRCPACRAAGWGTVYEIRGIPCRWRGRHVPIARAEIDGCWNCGIRINRTVGETVAEPGMCDQCNP